MRSKDIFLFTYSSYQEMHPTSMKFVYCITDKKYLKFDWSSESPNKHHATRPFVDLVSYVVAPYFFLADGCTQCIVYFSGLSVSPPSNQQIFSREIRFQGKQITVPRT